MSEKTTKPVYSTPPPISSMLGVNQQGTLSQGVGNKYTNVYMPNQQQAVMEYVSEPYIPPEIEAERPLESMLIKKRAIGNETDLEIAINDIEFDAISLFRQVGGEDLALDMALSYLHHREGLRAFMGFEREHQVMQKTIESLTTINQAQRQAGFFGRVGNFVTGKKQTGQG